MRNKEFYLLILKDKTMAWAYAYITENLKRPSFVYEPQNAYAAYKEIFGVDFASPEEMKTASQAEEIARLKEELEAVKIAAKQAVTQPLDGVDGKVDGTTETFENESDKTADESSNAAGDTTNTVIYATKEEFKTAHPEFKGLTAHHEWQRYVKELKARA
jgi:hypothetical protein